MAEEKEGITVKIDADLHAEVKAYVESQGLTMAEFVSKALDDELHFMPDDPRPIKPGTCGTVRFVDDIGTLHCEFDDGRMLGVIWGVDSFSVIEQKEAPAESEDMDMG